MSYCWYGCYECGGGLKKIGNVPPETYECKHCNEVIRMTEENKVRCKNTYHKKRRDYTPSRDKYPSYLRPNFHKIAGKR